MTIWRAGYNRMRSLFVRAEQKLYGLGAYTMRRADNPYATHLPVLIGLARLMPIRRVLELGSGEISTVVFLDRQAFPDLERLQSYEDDGEWAQRVVAKTAGDARVTVTTVEPPMSDRVADILDWDVDLIFIDDSLNAAARSATITAVARHSQSGCPVAVHDFEVLEYRHAARAWPHRHAFTGFAPHVGLLLWRGQSIVRNKLKRLDEVIASNADSIAPDDISGWVEIFDRTL